MGCTIRDLLRDLSAIYGGIYDKLMGMVSAEPLIAVHGVPTMAAAMDWIQSQPPRTIVLSLLPLDDVPELVPIHSYLGTDTADRIANVWGLYTHLANQAPDEYSPKACLDLCRGLLTASPTPLMYTIPWLTQALSDYEDALTNHRQKRAARVADLVMWLNHHADRVVVWGWDPLWLTDMPAIIRDITGSVHWLLPDYAPSTRSLASLTLTPPPETPIDVSHHRLQLFADTEQEITTVLDHIRSRSGQTVLVVPDPEMLTTLIPIASRMGLRLAADRPIRLTDTYLGQLVSAIMGFWETPALTTLRHVVYGIAERFPSPYPARLQDLDYRSGFDRSPQEALADALAILSTDPLLSRIESLKTWSDVAVFLRPFYEDYPTDPRYYVAYETSQHIQRILDDAIANEAPSMWVIIALSETRIFLRDPATVIAIHPESMGRYRDYPTWIMGMGQASWLGESPSLEEHASNAQSFRWGLAHWLLNSPHIIGVSAAKIHRQGPNDPPHHLVFTPHPVLQPPLLNQRHFTRPARKPYLPQPPATVSPSQLQWYNRCPYAFYLNTRLTIPQPMTDYQHIGIRIHDVIEAMITADSPLSIDQALPPDNPLIQAIVRAKMRDEWPLDDLMTFCQTGSVSTEDTVTITLPDITIRGRSDICLIHDGITHIIDIKTGTVPSNADVIACADIQLGLYLWGHGESAQHVAYYYNKDRLIKRMDSNDPAFGNFWQAFTQRIHDLVGGIVSGAYRPEDHAVSERHHRDACRRCRVYGVCADPGRHQR
jgi:RecB family exonuclease